jgi:hypothetical protein
MVHSTVISTKVHGVHSTIITLPTVSPYCYCSTTRSKNKNSTERSEVLTALLPRIQAFWIVKLCQSVNDYQCFKATMNFQNVSNYLPIDMA